MAPSPQPDDQLAPEQMLELIQRQRRRTRSALLGGYSTLLLVWAIAWFVGFLALWSADEVGGNPWFRIPVVPAAIIFGVAMAGSIITSIVTGVRSGAGIRGRSRLSGAMYGWSWTIVMLAAWLLLTAMQRAGLSGELMGVLAPAVFVFLTGVLYLAGGALFRAPVQYALGLVMIAVAVIATFVGSPTHYLIYATVGPVAMFIVAILMRRGLLPADASGDEDAR